MSTLTIPDDTYQLLAQLAAKRHLAIDHLIAELVVRSAAEQATPEAAEQPAVLAGDAWVRKFEEVNRAVQADAARYPAGFRLDDSRETMYQGREG